MTSTIGIVDSVVAFVNWQPIYLVLVDSKAWEWEFPSCNCCITLPQIVGSTGPIGSAQWISVGVGSEWLEYLVEVVGGNSSGR